MSVCLVERAGWDGGESVPLREYRCKRCGEVFEVLLASGAPEAVACGKCGSKAVEKQLSAPSVHVKGSHSRSGECSRETPCCGRERRCDAPPCGRR